jgi:hypothetical protein
MKWRVERLTDKKTGPKVTEAYQKMIAKVLARVKAQLETLAKPTDLDKLCDATVQAIVQAAHRHDCRPQANSPRPYQDVVVRCYR